MKVTDRQGHLNHVELDFFLLEAVELLQVSMELATSAEAHDEVDFKLGLEDEIHVDKEGVFDFQQDLLLLECFLDKVHVEKLLLAKLLQGVNGSSLFLLNNKDLAEVPSSNDSLDIEVSDRLVKAVDVLEKR